MDQPRVVSNPNVMLGKPIIAGTRITVEHVLKELGAGTTIDELLEMHPHLTREMILAALRYAADAVRLQVVYPSGTDEVTV
jgi:uncharacterized protein (DUF433 family)